MTSLQEANANRWAHAKITRGGFDAVAKKLVANKARYQAVEALTGVPWFVIAVIHNRESGADFDGVLHNGENIIGTKRKRWTIGLSRGLPRCVLSRSISCVERCCSSMATGPWAPMVNVPAESFCGRVTAPSLGPMISIQSIMSCAAAGERRR